MFYCVLRWCNPWGSYLLCVYDVLLHFTIMSPLEVACLLYWNHTPWCTFLKHINIVFVIVVMLMNVTIMCTIIIVNNVSWWHSMTFHLLLLVDTESRCWHDAIFLYPLLNSVVGMMVHFTYPLLSVFVGMMVCFSFSFVKHVCCCDGKFPSPLINVFFGMIEHFLPLC